MHSGTIGTVNKETRTMAGYCLKNIPPEIFKFLIYEQRKLQDQRGIHRLSAELALYVLLREHPKFIEFKKKLEQDEIKSMHNDV